MQMSYWRFAAMIATSTVVMFGVMYLNTYALEHVLWSETRAWMALLMGGVMAVIMLSFMLNMYQSKGINIAIYAGSALVFALCLWLVRSQATVGEVEYMEAMVPHHSIAIMTSERAQIADHRVRKLADEIIEAQRREIAEMKYLIHDLEQSGGGAEQPPAEGPMPEVVSAAEAIRTPDVPRIDLGTLNPAEIDKVVPPGPRCSFAYTAASPAILAGEFVDQRDAALGVVKIHGRLVAVTAEQAAGSEALAGRTVFTAEGLRLELNSLLDEETDAGEGERRWPADLVFELDQGLRAGYRGWYTCSTR